MSLNTLFWLTNDKYNILKISVCMRVCVWGGGGGWVGVGVVIRFCFVACLYVFSSLVIIVLKKRELDALL